MKALTRYSVMVLSVALLFSCSKERPIDNHTPEANTGEVSAKWENAANSSNPYEADSFGIKHNQGLDMAISYKDSYSDHDEWFDSVPSLVGTFAFGADTDPEFLDFIDTYYPESPDGIDPAMWSFDSLLAVLSTAQQPFIQTLFDSMATATSYTDFKAKVVDWEGTVLNDRVLTDAEKEDLLQGGNLARYSCYYWYYELMVSESSLWGGFSFNKTTQITLSDVIDIASADVSTGLRVYRATGNLGLAIAGGLAASIVKAIDIFL